MKKNYIYLLVLILATVALTLLFSFLYRQEVVETSYSYENFNKITATEFEEYMIEHPDTIIYISDKANINNNKFEKKLVKKLEKMNILENVIYIDKEEVSKSLKNKLEKEYSYKYDEKNLPVIIVVNDGETSEIAIVDENSTVDKIINYEVFE